MIGARRRIGPDTSGASAVEFALTAPIFCIILAVTADFGGVLYAKFGLDGAVSAAANYALLNAAKVGSTNGASLASNLAVIVASTHATNWANGSVVINNGPTATLTAGTVTSGGTAANADSCYCPTKGATGIAWGAATTCGATCAGGSLAGKFVTIAASRTYSPVFSSYGIVSQGAIGASAVVETQ